MHKSRWAWLAALCALVVAAGGLSGAPAAKAASSCAHVAAPTGSDSAPGSESQPFRSAQRLFDALGPGETGCLRGGTYVTSESFVRTPEVTITSYPGETAVLGSVEIKGTAAGATVSDLSFDGELTVYADDAVVRGNEITNHNTDICLKLGGREYTVDRVLVEGNEIHHCGRLPRTNLDHGIYASRTQHLVVRSNLIHHNADRGVQLYPNSDHARVIGNVIDGNGVGVIFSGASGMVSENNVVEHNLITFSNARDNVESYWNDGQVGAGNRVRENCIHGGAEDNGDGGIESPQEGFVAIGNTLTDPRYTNRAAGDYRLRSGSPCSGILVGALADSLDAEGTGGEDGETGDDGGLDGEGGGTGGAGDDGSTGPVGTQCKGNRKPCVRLSAETGTVSAGEAFVLEGRVRGAVPAVGQVKIQAQIGEQWTTVSKRRFGQGRRFRVGLEADSDSAVIRYRAKVRQIGRSRPLPIVVNG